MWHISPDYELEFDQTIGQKAQNTHMSWNHCPQKYENLSTDFCQRRVRGWLAVVYEPNLVALGLRVMVLLHYTRVKSKIIKNRVSLEHGSVQMANDESNFNQKQQKRQ